MIYFPLVYVIKFFISKIMTLNVIHEKVKAAGMANLWHMCGHGFLSYLKQLSFIDYIVLSYQAQRRPQKYFQHGLQGRHFQIKIGIKGQARTIELFIANGRCLIS